MTSRIKSLGVLFRSLYSMHDREAPASLRRSVEVIVGGVAAFGFGVDVRRVAAFGRRLAAVGVDALNGGHVAEQAVAGVTHDIHQQPRNGIGIERVDVRCGFAGDFAAIFQLPGGTGEMLSDHFIFAVVQVGVGSLERPSEFAVRRGLAGIDLRAGGVRVDDNSIPPEPELRRERRARVLRS